MLQNPKLWLGAVSALGVLLVVVKDSLRSAPGDLTRVHLRDSELSSSQGCVQCHGAGETRLADACLECHTDVGEHIDDGRGLHGSMQPNLVQECALCHSEHHGSDFPIVNRRSFFIAGVADPDAFDHELVGFAMDGVHLELLCVDCHANAADPVLPEGARRYMGLEQDCATCHQDPHDGRMAKSCAECHSQHAFEDMSGFVHDERFELVGSHAGASCVECHAERGAHSIEASGSAGGPARWRECIDCHESPHRAPFVKGVALLEDSTAGASCVACHAVEHALFASDEVGVTEEQHAVSGFPLVEPHAGLECAECHSENLAGARSFDARYPGRAADACQLCHDDAHRGFFEARAAPRESTACAGCHLPTTFSSIAPGSFDHAHWTAFALLGAHEQSACASCHPASPEPDDLGRRFGWAAQHFGAIEGCASCHTDPHEGQFDVPDLPANVDGRLGCARCHNESSFRAFPHGFDHTLWTGFALDGKHGEQSCSACHTPQRRDAIGRTWARADGTNCADCHADSHAGQFAEDGATDCRRCHQDTNHFETLVFNHNIDSQFPLDATHTGLSCNQCHRLQKAGGVETVRYKPMGRECIDCHGATRSRVRSRGKNR